jgi:hypothetical protein
VSFEILHRYTKAVVYTSATADDIASAVKEAACKGANLRGADLQGADLGGADLQGAYLQRAYLQGAYLQGAKGLLSTGIVPLQIGGSRHWIIVREDGYITIGCEHHPVEWWEQNGATVAVRENYSDAEIEEYRQHVAYAKAWMERNGVLKIKEATDGTSA